MDFRRRKLRLALVIMALGMLVALLWHGWQGWMLGRGYPYDTFLAQSAGRGTDLIALTKAARDPDPYSCRFSLYFPATYIIFHSVCEVDRTALNVLFLTFTSVGLVWICWLALRPLGLNVIPHVLAAIGLVALSFPVWFGMDRGNIEIQMALLIGAMLLCFQQRRYHLGLLCLFPAICIKFYPILLTALFLRPRHWFKIVAVSLFFLGVSLLSLASFHVPMETSWREWSSSVRLYGYQFITQNWGFAGSASLWNTCKAIVMSGYSLTHPAYRPDVDLFPFALIHRAYEVYWFFAFAGFMAITIYALFLETEFFRRAILLLLESVVLIPSGADYRLIYVNIALVILILLPKMRRHDLLVTGLLAFILVPKKEVFLTYLGASDSGVNDIPIAILINPPCLLAVVILLIWDGWPERPVHRFRQRVSGLVGSLWRPLVMLRR